AAEEAWLAEGGGKELPVLAPPPPANPHGKLLIDFFDVFFEESELLAVMGAGDGLIQGSGAVPGLDVAYAPEPTMPCRFVGYTAELRGEAASGIRTVKSVILHP